MQTREKNFLLRRSAAHIGGHLCVVRTNKNNSYEIQFYIKGKKYNGQP